MSIKNDRKKTRTLRIRCTKDTVKRFNNFQIEYDQANYEEALIKLLNLADKYPDDQSLRRVRWG